MGLDQHQSRPVSWETARMIIKDILETYLDEISDVTLAPSPAPSGNSPASLLWRTVKASVVLDLDLLLGSGLASLGLLILAIFGLIRSNDGGMGTLRPGAPNLFYRAQLAGACMLLVGSVMSLWMVRRRRELGQSGADNAKRQEITSFLKHMQEYEYDRDSSGDYESLTSKVMSLASVNSNDFTGSALSGVYPVYRRITGDEKSASSWKRVPALLLVKGDFVALQVGDKIPALCESIDDDIRVQAGDRVTLDAISQSSEKLASTLPKGRTTIPPQSDHFLTVCNGMAIFRLLESPIYGFIRAPRLIMRTSQAGRKAEAIRTVLWLLAPLIFCLTCLAAFTRPGIFNGDVTMFLHLPLLAALGVLPVVLPAFLFFLEILGTSRILKAVHPHALSEEDLKGNDLRYGLLVKYCIATTLSRLSLWDATRRFRRALRRKTRYRRTKLVRVPPASINLLEKLGVCTAFTLVDDELACEPHAVPQQLLIPSGKGLKLLDMCPTYDDDDESDADFDDSEGELARGHRRTKSIDSASDSDEEDQPPRYSSSLRRKILRRPHIRRRKPKSISAPSNGNETDGTDDSDYEVQFEDPLWWQHLPSLKCIGLSCLLVDSERDRSEVEAEKIAVSKDPETLQMCSLNEVDGARSTLVSLICAERQSHQLKLLAECIGFDTEPNSLGAKGDITPFAEKLRLHILSTRLFKTRVSLDSHERSSEQSRWMGLIRPDSTSVIVQDSRTGTFQLLTVGDPEVVSELCSEAWQGEISTILPLASSDRRTILETCRNWKLADLDVAAFSYTPVPHTFESRQHSEDAKSQTYLLDNGVPSSSLLKDKTVSEEWTLVRNQIFLGVLGSLVVPRREIQGLLSNLSDAGVRFVYFSPRNMRRQKELASQMGIDVAWNCAISLRPLEAGEEDPHRMVSNYADWDINAKLPHGVQDVRTHLHEVDNVPLLVSLFTDATKHTTREMVEIFQEYNDTVISVGVAHLPWNANIFAAADISVSIDVLNEQGQMVKDKAPDTEHKSGGKDDPTPHHQHQGWNSNYVLPAEHEFVAAIASHACAFRFRGASSLSNLSSIIAAGRTAWEAAHAAVLFVVQGSLSFAIYVLGAACVPSTVIPFVPTLGTVLYLQIVLPLLGLSIGMSQAPRDCMKQVPPKNDPTQTFARQEGRRLYQMLIFKAAPPAVLVQLLQMIVFGELMLALEPELVARDCPGTKDWPELVRCDALREYSGSARSIAGSIVLTAFVSCQIVVSASFVRRHELVVNEVPWDCNVPWLCTCVVLLALTVVYAAVASGDAVDSGMLPWYFYMYTVLVASACLAWCELCKRVEIRHERRAEKLRRLQFETRLGAWSPK